MQQTFKEYVLMELGGTSTISPSSSIEDFEKDNGLNDNDGEKFARALKARYLGHRYNLYWFDDLKTGSAYVAKDFQSALQKREDLWNRFKHPAN